MIIGIDFDGTCVTHEYPHIGKEIGAISVLKKIIDNGHELIIHTMRSGDTLNAAVKFLNDNGIELFGVNKNPNQKSWTTSPKPYCHLYIDDTALGCPIIYNSDVSMRPYVNWVEVENMLINLGIIK